MTTVTGCRRVQAGEVPADRNFPVVGLDRPLGKTARPWFFRLPGRRVSTPLLLSGLLSGGIHAAMFFVGGDGTPSEKPFRAPRADAVQVELVPADDELPASTEEGGPSELRFAEAPRVPSVPEPAVAVARDAAQRVIDVPSVVVSGALADADGFVRRLSRGDGEDGKTLQAVFNLADLDRAPVVEAQPLPRYPAALEHARVTGEVLVGFVVDAKGRVRNARIVESSRIEFEEAALQAVNRWKFQPGRKGGRAVAVRMEAPIAFSLPKRP